MTELFLIMIHEVTSKRNIHDILKCNKNDEDESINNSYILCKNFINMVRSGYGTMIQFLADLIAARR